MRKVAGYSFEQSFTTPEDGEARVALATTAVEAWLDEKGTVDQSTGAFALRDGRKGHYRKTEIAIDGAKLTEHSFQEPTDGGPIQTDIKIGVTGGKILTYVELRAGAPLNWVGPINLDIRCPRVVRAILGGSMEWKLGETPLGTKPINFLGTSGASKLDAVIWHTERNLPVVCISEDDDGPLTEGISDRMAADLSGLAIVAHIDSAAAWNITNLRGKEWSCFGGAIRLYWPRVSGSNPLQHPLWTKLSLLRDAGSADGASRKIRHQIRRRILGLSAFSISEPSDLRQIRDKHAAAVTAKERAKLQSKSEWEKLADSYSEENDDLKIRLNASETEINDLRVQLANLQGALQWKETTESEVAPRQELPPTTVTEAVDRARKSLSRLYFGADVDTGVAALSGDAGPPEKVLDYLEALQEMAEEQAKGPLGVTQIQWLKDRGIHGSGESETILNSNKEMKKRTWAGPNGQQRFEKHLKPNDNIAPDKCVRIYFEAEPERDRIVVGWIGRHPG
ncbi:hypothetical protein [Solimonas marina]|uniref:Uncharacterized protein n=1 Tax=Solimonas marina TaxID=2714601 RepID=A0A970B4Q3_9GAMM|nr:hypothetical protein [Solimonas marina]NKF20873.1 hypothetical protein [Solimonas marina]